MTFGRQGRDLSRGVSACLRAPGGRRLAGVNVAETDIPRVAAMVALMLNGVPVGTIRWEHGRGRFYALRDGHEPSGLLHRRGHGPR